MIKIRKEQIEAEVMVCPYCMSEVQTDPHMGCCGEVHADKAYMVLVELITVELFLESEVEIDMNYGVDALPELIAAVLSYMARLEIVLNQPELQTRVDKHGNEACRLVRGGTRSALQTLNDVLRRANDTESSRSEPLLQTTQTKESK